MRPPPLAVADLVSPKLSMQLKSSPLVMISYTSSGSDARVTALVDGSESPSVEGACISKWLIVSLGAGRTARARA